MLQPRNVIRLVGHKFSLAVILLLIAYIVFQFVIPAVSAPIPRSLLVLYMGITLLAVLIGFSSNAAWWEEFLRPLRTLLLERERRSVVWLRRGLGVLIPLLVGALTLQRLNPSAQAPAELRAIHPAPPSSIQFRGESIDIQGLDNPFWGGPPERPEPALVEEGREVYAKHCVYCHGDALAGDGIFADGLNPRPADFTDPGTIAQLQQSYLFWRIAKGGPQLPTESAPWNSAMPAWEKELSAEEIWKVIVFLYEAAGPGVNPRTWEE